MRRGEAVKPSPIDPLGSFVAAIALQPVMDIQDQVVVAYEVQPRPRPDADAAAVACAALRVAQHSSPAILLVPFPDVLLVDEGFDPLAAAQEVGASPHEVAWMMRAASVSELADLAASRAAELRAGGFLLAVEGVGTGTRAGTAVAALRPDFVVLDPLLTGRIGDDDVARAEVAGLLAFVSRLQGRVIARGIGSGGAALPLVELGVQLGSGPYFGGPVVLEPAAAATGDALVTPSWFRERAVRVFEPRGEALDAPALLTTLPAVGEEVDDQSFARTLGATARLLQAEHDPTRILAVIADLLPRVVPADRLAILEADWDNHQFAVRVGAGEGAAELAATPFGFGVGVTGWAFARGLPYNCPDASSHPASAAIVGTADLRESLLVIPLIAGDHRLGVIDLWRTGTDRFTEADLERAALFGYIAAAAWRNAQLYAELEQRAMTDALTGLLNTRWWNEVAPREAAQSLRSGAPIGLVLADLDHFKLVNDRGGHALGDVVLRNIARSLRSVVRSGDAAVRYGGEEFLLVLPGSDERGALRVAESVQGALRELPAPLPGMTPVTVSMGVAQFPRDGATLDAVVRAADLAMYRAKSDGRDRIVLVSAMG